MLRLLATGLILATGIALGLGLTLLTTGSRPPLGALRAGVWAAWPTSGTPAADPYQRAYAARTGRLPLGAAAGLRFTATRDAAGQPLEGRCAYELSGATPPAQFWTVTVLDPEGRPRPAPDPRDGMSSTELVRGPDGGFRIALARQARPGNWVPTRGDGPFELMLSVYDTPLGTALQNGGSVPSLPTLAKVACP